MVQVPPVPRGPIVDLTTGKLTPESLDLLERQLDRIGGSGDRGVVGVQEIVIQATDLTAGATKRLVRARQTEQWRVRDILIGRPGANFAGGDRDMEIKSGTTVWTVIPSATLLSFTTARWGSTDVPYPATAADFATPTAPGEDIVAQRTGGTSDYTSGSMTLVLFLERAA